MIRSNAWSGRHEVSDASNSRRQVGPVEHPYQIDADDLHLQIPAWTASAAWISALPALQHRSSQAAPGASRIEWTPAGLAMTLGGIDLKATRKRPRHALAST